MRLSSKPAIATATAAAPEVGRIELTYSALRRLALAAFDGVVIHDRHRILDIDASCSQLWGYTPDEVIGRPLALFFPPGVYDSLETLANNGQRKIAVPALRKDGSIFHVELSIAVGGLGVPTVSAVRDITPEAEAAARLAESELRYRELSESTHDLICRHDLDGSVLEVNAASCRALGYTREQLVGKNVRNFLAPGGAHLFDAYLEAILRDGVAEGVMTIRTATGERRLWQYQNMLETRGVERPLVRGLARDVTERERAIDALHENEEYFRSIIENVSDIVTTISPQGMVEYHSASISRVLGYDEHEFAGCHFADFVHPDEAPAARAMLKKQFGDPAATSELEVRLRHRDGSWRWVSLTVTNRRVRNHVRSVIINGHDVTTARQLHAQLEQANRVNSLGRLAATVAHEFNNVLMGMAPFAELMQRPNVPASVVDKGSKYILNSIARGKRVAMDILRFTRPAEPALVPVDLHQWWAHFAPEMHGRLSDAIAFETDVPAELVILADADQLSQVFSNIIVNARDAMPRGGRLIVRARRPAANERFAFGFVPKPHKFVHFEVTDSGTGMPPEVVEHVFDPLFTTKRNGGTGLGMAVAHNIITRHGGAVFVVSEVGVGTTFHIFLPLSEGRSVEAAVEAPARPIRVQRILLIDDERMIVEGLAEAFRHDGRLTAVALSGAEGESLVETFRPDVVLLDIRLPDVDGFELGARLRERHPALKIVYVSGDADGRSMPCDERAAFLQKPFDARTLCETIATLEEVNS